MLFSINLALATLCGATCIFCPAARGNDAVRVMPAELAKKIIDEVAEPFFQHIHGTKNIILGENGDLFLNKHCLEIMRYIRAKSPNMRTIIYTNFQNADPAVLEAIVRENLVDFINCNIDSVNEDTYRKIKGLELSRVLTNFNAFLALRRQYASQIPVQVYCIPLYTYIKAVWDNYGVLAAKAGRCNGDSIVDDFALTQAYLEKLLNPAMDRIVKVESVICWAERDNLSPVTDYSQYHCPNLGRIQREAFIAPNGDWYVCCYDAKNQVVLGNVSEESLQAIFFSAKRKLILDQLANQQFQLVGGPCTTVQCCQFVAPVPGGEGQQPFLVPDKS